MNKHASERASEPASKRANQRPNEQASKQWNVIAYQQIYAIHCHGTDSLSVPIPLYAVCAATWLGFYSVSIICVLINCTDAANTISVLFGASKCSDNVLCEFFCYHRSIGYIFDVNCDPVNHKNVNHNNTF